MGRRALDCWYQEWKPLRRDRRDYGEWDWTDLRRRLRRPDRFEVAIWREQGLCGLAVGKVSAASSWVGIAYLEGSPHRHHSARRWITLIAATAAAA